MDASQQSFASTTAGTLHASQSSAASSSAFSLAIPPANFPGLSQETTSSTSSTLVDPNSPELFKQHVQIAMEHVARVNALARSALNGLQNAYRTGINPAQTQADLTALNQALHALAEVLRQSGVGAYPLPPPANAQNASPPTEQELITDTTRGVQQLYEEFKRMQESSAVVANLLSSPESLGRPRA